MKSQENRNKPWLQARCDRTSIGSALVCAVVGNETAAQNHAWPWLEQLSSWWGSSVGLKRIDEGNEEQALSWSAMKASDVAGAVQATLFISG